MRAKARLVLGPIIILTTIGVFAFYLARHTYLLHELSRTKLSTVGALLVLNAVAFSSLILLLHASLRVAGKRMSAQENFLLSAYSSLINFFGPGQSGPAVRAAYLKKRHQVRLRDYTLATLVYYGCYAVVSALLLCVRSAPWWLTILALIGAGGLSVLIIKKFAGRAGKHGEGAGLTGAAMGWILAATLLQAAAQIAMYFVELHSINRHISLGQVVTYTGAANFSLFVALTPGAIGIRESFLVFSEHLHHVSSATIVAANVLDRAMYILFLGALFVLVLALHANDRLHIKQLRAGMKGKA